MSIPFVDFLRELLSQPMAPYREIHVRRWLTHELESSGVPFFEDPIGNIIVGVDSKKSYLKKVNQKSKEPVRLFIAHMDHPGFHGVKWLGNRRLAVRFFGGTPTQHLNGAKVWLADDKGWWSSGILGNAKLLKSKAALQEGVVTFPKGAAEDHFKTPHELFGGFQFRKPVWNQGKLLYTKAADDLIGVGAIVWLAKHLYRTKSSARNNFIGLLSRAEEVGFIGTIAHLNLNWFTSKNRPTICVSLETSRTLPGAIIGKGPVVRLGDRATVFDPGAIQVLQGVASKLIPGKFQRRIMDGGTCEATAATVFGIRSLGISVPLGNYHNQSFEGGPDSRGKLGPAPEFVHLDDIHGMYDLCQGLVANGLPWAEPWASRKADFLKRLKESKTLLS